MIPRPHRLSSLLLVCPLLVAGTVSAREIPQDPPVVAALHRAGIEKKVRGLVLLGELGCASCHDPGGRRDHVTTRTAPDLSAAGTRIQPAYLEAFLADPHGTKPGTVMPDVLSTIAPDARAAAAEALTHYLRSIAKQPFRSQKPDPQAAERGHELFRTIGCAACHAPRNAEGKEQPMKNAVPLGALHRKYGVPSLTAFLEEPHRVRASGRMPAFRMQPREAFDLANFLLLGTAPAKTAQPGAIDKGKARRGKELFAKLDCVRCHAMDGVQPNEASIPALARLDPAKGCLSDTGDGPRYPLSDTQKNDIRAALTVQDFAPTDEQRIRKDLVTFNCIACHQRGDLGGVETARDEMFESADMNLGETSRFPPPLTGAGAKLQAKWLHDTLAYGQSTRPYMKTRMPGFGAANTARLAALLKKVDKLEPAGFEPLPKDRKQARVTIDMGRKMVGNQGLNCIACHTFRGERASAMAAVDLIETTTQRLEMDWFYHYMSNPIRFRKDTIMPRFFFDGVSTRKDIAEGDAKAQIRAMWHYLAKGRNTRQPSGMVRPSMEIVVGDEPVVLRRNAQNTGKRGISVGLPEKVHYTFDAESLALNQVWWGRFIDPASAWTGQGSGQVRIMERQRASLPKGPAFAALKDPTAPWPTVSRRDLGHRFRGYDLDAKRRPVFLYDCEGVSITDAPVAVIESTGPILRRVLRFSGEGDKTIWFRAALDPTLAKTDAKTVQIAKGFAIRIPNASFRIRDAVVQVPAPKNQKAPKDKKDAKPTEKKTRELIVEVQIRKGGAELVLEYIRHGGKK